MARGVNDFSGIPIFSILNGFNRRGPTGSTFTYLTKEVFTRLIFLVRGKVSFIAISSCLCCVLFS